MKPFLIFSPDKNGKKVVLENKDTWVIGRHTENDIPLQDGTVSKRHAQIHSSTRGLVLTDLGSRNGTFLNKKRLTNPTVLQDGDELLIGSTVIQFRSSVPTDPHSRTITPEYQTQVIHERKLISILVVDIKGYTPLTRQVDEQVLAQLMSTWNTFCGNEVVCAGGWTHKFIGDAMMAVWLHDEKATSEEINSIFRTLSEIRKFTSTLRERFSLPVEVQIGAGINTGYAMIGNSGSSDSPDFTPIGDTVNAAFRYESATRTVDAELLIGSTFDYLGEPKPTFFKSYNLYLKGYDGLKKLHGCSFDDLENSVENSQNNNLWD